MISSEMLKQHINLKVSVAFSLLGFALYWSGLQAPWYFDDFRNIVESPLLQDLNQSAQSIFQPRGVAFFSFSLNYYFSGLSPQAFRFFNIIIHIIAALLCWKILSRIYPGSRTWPLVGGLIFLVHPVQTQAITYIVQRMASMSTAFFLLAVYLYLLARDNKKKSVPLSAIFWAGSILAGAFAIWTKQNTVVLPFVLLALDRLIIDRKNFQLSASLKRLAPLLLIVGLACIQQFSSDHNIIETLSIKADSYSQTLGEQATQTTPLVPQQSVAESTPLRYFGTELVIYWVYIKLVLLPYGQALDYSWPLVPSLFNLQTLGAVLAFLVVFAGLCWKKLWTERLLLGMTWVILTLAIESSFLPLDPIYEHRLYLPMLGITIILIELFFIRMPANLSRPVLIFIIVGLSILTIQRNALWQTPIAFWQDNLDKTPQNARAMSNLAQAYIEDQQYPQAEALLRKARTLSPGVAIYHASLGTVLLHQGLPEQARGYLMDALKLDPENALANSYLGTILVSTGETDQGLNLLNLAVGYKPRDETYRQNLAVGLDIAGQTEAATEAYREWLQLAPNNDRALLGLGVLLDKTGRSAEGLKKLESALAIKPEDPALLYHYGLTASHAGNRSAYQIAVTKLRQIDPNRAARLQQRASK